jgi:hypothetical protein
MLLNEVSNIISFILADRKPDLVVSAGEFERQLHVAQLKLFKTRLGLPESYRPGAPVPGQVWEISKVITDDLAPFKVLMGGTDASLVIDDDGIATLPADFYYPSSLIYKYIKSDGSVDWKEVDLVTDKEWNKRQASHIKRPSLKAPIGNIYKNKIRFSPVTLHYVDFMYLRTPTAPVYGTSYGKGYQKYDPATSTELEWNDTCILDIIGIFLGDLGVSVTNGDLVNYSEKIKATGT